MAISDDNKKFLDDLVQYYIDEWDLTEGIVKAFQKVTKNHVMAWC